MSLTDFYLFMCLWDYFFRELQLSHQLTLPYLPCIGIMDIRNFFRNNKDNRDSVHQLGEHCWKSIDKKTREASLEFHEYMRDYWEKLGLG